MSSRGSSSRPFLVRLPSCSPRRSLACHRHYAESNLTHTDAAPTTGEAITTITNDFQSLVMPGITHWQHPKFFGYFPAGVTFESILADMYAASVTNPGFNVSATSSRADVR